MARKRQRGTSSLRGIAVAGGFRAGKRKKGQSLLKRQPVTVIRIGDIRKETILAAIADDPATVVWVNWNGAVKQLDYRK